MELIPKYFREFARHSWGDIGADWVSELERVVIPEITRELGLRDISVADNLTMNLLWKCHSDAFGTDVFVKFGNPSGNTISEIRFMQESNDIHEMASCLFIDDKRKIIVMPNMLPGDTLDTVESMEDRIRVVAKMADAARIPIPNLSDMEFGDFQSEMRDKIGKVRRAGTGDSMAELEHNANLAESILDDFGYLGAPTHVLHGDLHARNVIKSGNEWFVIDPMACVMDDAYATCKFSSHELVEGRVDISASSIRTMQSMLAEATGTDFQELLRAFYVDTFDWYEFAVRSRSPQEVVNKLSDIEDIVESMLE